jgi:hypothetical protein
LIKHLSTSSSNSSHPLVAPNLKKSKTAIGGLSQLSRTLGRQTVIRDRMIKDKNRKK